MTGQVPAIGCLFVKGEDVSINQVRAYLEEMTMGSSDTSKTKEIRFFVISEASVEGSVGRVGLFVGCFCFSLFFPLVFFKRQ